MEQQETNRLTVTRGICSAMGDNASLELSGSSIFNVAPVQFQTDITNISSLSVSNDILVIGFKSGKLFRIDLNNPTVIQTLELPYKRSIQELGKIERVFQDPTGNHLIITTSRNENFYIHKKSSTFKYLNDLKSSRISSIAWNVQAVTESSTGAFLIGDKGGSIHEAFLEYQESTVKYTKKINKNIHQSPSSIDGISLKYHDDTGDIVIVVVSGDDIAYWNDSIKKNSTVKYNDLFLSSIFKLKPTEFEKYQDLGNINGEKFTFNGSDLVWLTAAGIVYGEISREKIPTKNNIPELKFLVNLELPESSHRIKSVALTKYHILLLRGQEILVINRLNDELVYNQVLPVSENERFIGIAADYHKSTYWVYSNFSLYEITVDDEEKDIWRAMVQNHKFSEALKVTNDIDAKDVIYTRQGDHFLEIGEPEEAAKSYAQSSKSFEAIALAFLEKGEKDALLQYFISKFTILKNDENFDFKMQLIILSSWVVELFIEKLNELDDILTTEQTSKLEETTLMKTSTEKSFQEFILENKAILDKKTIYEIITSHNRRSELLYYANLIGDYDFVLAYWIRLENWSEALKILEKNNDPEVVYKYSTVLLVNAPIITVDSWLRMSNIEAQKVLPAILTYNKNAKKVKADKHQGIRYLSSVIRDQKSKDSIIHDLFLYLLISNESSNNEDLVLRYLEEYGAQFYYNPDFLLRLCLKTGKIKSAALIYSDLGFFEDAVNLSLENDMIDLAMIVADKPDDDKVRKFLWLKIAKRKISTIRPSENEQIKQEVKSLLARCEFLAFKDLLPLLPDFTTIDNLKDEICTDLENFGTIINKLTAEMSSSMSINENITQDISKYKEKSQVIEAGESCSTCEFLLTSRKFFIFPCNHAFHSDCLIKEILKSSDYATKKRLDFLQKRFLSNKHEKGDKFINSPEVDALLSKRCPLCSDLKIDSIDRDFVSDSKKDDWDI